MKWTTGRNGQSSKTMLARLKTRTFRVGGYSVAAAAIVIAIAVFANLFINALPATLTQFDTTSSQLYSFSEQTETILKKLDRDISIYWIVQSGKEDDTLGTLLDRYAALSDHITVEKRDPDVYPTFVQQYVTGSIYNNSLIVESADRYTYVSYEDIYEYSYDDYFYTGSADVSFDGEGALTGAIDYVVSEDLPKMYVLTGHGEKTMSTSFQSAVEKQNIEMENLSLLTVEGVPEDADCILIYGPEGDISMEEKDAILRYLQDGGNLILLTDPTQDGEGRPNLEALMEYYGVTAEKGIVVEGGANNFIFPSQIDLLPNLESHAITQPLNEGGYYVYLRIAQGLTVGSAPRDTVSVTELLTTSSSAYSKVSGYAMETYEKEAGDVDGPFALAVAITEEVDENTQSHIVWLSSSYLLDDQANMKVSGGNQDFFLNCISWMCEQESGISIHAKSLSYEYLTISSGTSSLLTLLMIGVLPIGYLLIGIVVWVRRKKR
ncbi:MAG: GldG family protein [Oscillospiraceae bacterium]